MRALGILVFLGGLLLLLSTTGESAKVGHIGLFTLALAGILLMLLGARVGKFFP